MDHWPGEPRGTVPGGRGAHQLGSGCPLLGWLEYFLSLGGPGFASCLSGPVPGLPGAL